jgi:hypothetical protein
MAISRTRSRELDDSVATRIYTHLYYTLRWFLYILLQLQPYALQSRPMLSTTGYQHHPPDAATVYRKTTDALPVSNFKKFFQRIFTLRLFLGLQKNEGDTKDVTILFGANVRRSPRKCRAPDAAACDHARIQVVLFLTHY